MAWRNTVELRTVGVSCLLALCAHASPPSSHAASTPQSALILQSSQSELAFRFTQAGAEASGRFTKFSGTLSWPAPSRLEVDVDVGSLDTRDAERDAILRGTDLFDATRFGRARFTSEPFEIESARRGSLRGLLKIRDRTRPVVLTIERLRVQGAGDDLRVELTGTATLQRLDFGLGQRDWASTEWVSNAVSITFRAIFAPASAR